MRKLRLRAIAGLGRNMRTGEPLDGKMVGLRGRERAENGLPLPSVHRGVACHGYTHLG